MERPPLHGTVKDIISDLKEYADAGVSHIVMEIPGDSFDDKFKAMDRFIKEIRPRVAA